MNAKVPGTAALQQFFLKDKIIRELELHRQWVERFMFVLGLVSSAMAIPQIMSIYQQGDSSQVSLLAWSFYTFSAFLWIIYGVVFKRPVVKRVNLLFFITNLLVVGFIFYFR